MSEQIKPSKFQPGERKTTARYSLEYDLIGSEDIIVRHPSGGGVRVIEYERADVARSYLREVLLDKGLILGRILGDKRDKKQHFAIPKSARPISYDASVDDTGAFSYNDEQMFFDLGSLLGEVYKATQEKPVITGDIGRAVAFVEFTRPDERQLYLVPGVERITDSLETGTSPLGYYAEKMTEAFGHRFDTASLSFRMGFSDATAKGE